MNDFRSYKPDNNKNNNGDFNTTADFAKAITKAMSGKNEGQIMRTIIAEAERGKREGRLTNADLDNFYNTVYPMLDSSKRKKLNEVIARLKNI
ncbi:MAG: hypothetical protein K2L12_06765 [Clostridia bacterium]|nr:hypothetical protein [Clostridia bacterium]